MWQLTLFMLSAKKTKTKTTMAGSNKHILRYYWERLWYPQWAFPSVQACLRRGLVYHWFYCHLKSHSNKQRVRSCRAVLNLLISLVCLLEAQERQNITASLSCSSLPPEQQRCEPGPGQAAAPSISSPVHQSLTQIGSDWPEEIVFSPPFWRR